jgi:BASS family bile acid:Na+ symporter
MAKKFIIRPRYFIPSIALLFGYIAFQFEGEVSKSGWLLMLFFLSLALVFQKADKLKGFSFPLIIFAAVSLTMYYPQHFVSFQGFKLSKLIIPLLQIIMFGMGSELSMNELATVFKMPKKILVGVVCHYTVMPLIGFVLVSIFSFPPEIAAGVILVGCCPSGLASNVMSYLARANLALSIAVTTVSTLLAPLFTPLLMRILAGKLIKVSFWALAWDTTQVVIFPILAGLLFHFLVRGKVKWLDKIMPMISMIGIALIIMVITASGRDALLKVGGLLMLAVLIHNMLGYTLGYWFSRLLGFEEKDCRTISLEVGMQNSGLASGLALGLGGIGTVGLASAIFGPLMNISGSSLATWWHGRVPKGEIEAEKPI